MSEIPSGYQNIPEEDRRKAKAFFDRGAAVAGTGNYDYSIEMFLQGLAIDPDAVEAHQALRDISLRRKASGGKKLGMFEAMKLRGGKDDKQSLLNAEKLLAYDPGNMDHMLTLMQSAHKSGFFDTVMWIGAILYRANVDNPKPEFSKFMALKDVYRALARWKEATEACQRAVDLKPGDMDLVNELKNLGAEHTMSEGKYTSGGSFRESVRDMDAQVKLMDADKDVRSEDVLTRQIKEAEAEWRAQPEEPGKIARFVDALVKSEKTENENRAIDVLASAFERTNQFRYRLNVGKIKLMQLDRAERSMRQTVAKNPQDEQLKLDYRAFLNDKLEEELKEYTLWAENYPTDLTYKYGVAKRLFQLGRYSDAIPVFQNARQDPKIRTDATIALGQSFLEAGFPEEAIDTLRGLIEEYQLKGDARSKEMYYWYARALEGQGTETQTALKAYSQVAQWDFNYRDVQLRIKRLRSSGAAPSQ